jgi:YD repeat-containing protein
VVVARDEVGRRQKMTYDILGRLKTTQSLFIQPKDQPLDGNGAVYSTTTNTCNVRDQVTNINTMDNATGVSQNTVMTYDGHGRLATRKHPIVSAVNAFVYNADDTLQTMTDPRGVTTTYSYNNRKMVTSVTYGTAPNVIPLNPVTFGYDEAGNRVWMDDQLGRVDYHYNTLSQMDWEERRFDELTEVYRLSYEYNLAGQLTKVVSPWSTSVSYTFNKAGEVTGVTGSGYFDIIGQTNRAVSQFATGIKYRAWGELKSFTNGNFTTEKSNFVYEYNQRMQLTHFDSGGRITDQTYFDDGRVKDVADIAHSNFDRTHEYDHIGRLISASAGTTAPKPFNFTYAYDAWNNTTLRSGTHWTCNSPGFAATYSNNRDTSMEYDAAGNVTQSGIPWEEPFITKTTQYDAAGRQSNVTECKHPNPITCWNRTHGYDGDSRPVMFQAQEEGSSFYNRYHYIRSSMLKGEILVEVRSNATQSGKKWRNYIYLHGERIAQQEYSQNTADLLVRWNYHNPVISTDYQHFRGADSVDSQKDLVVDPVGARVQTTNPCVSDPEPPPHDPSDPERRGDIIDFDSGCNWDGLDVPCTLAMRALHGGGAAVEAPESLIRYNWDKRRFEFFRAFANGTSGWLANGSFEDPEGNWRGPDERIIELDRSNQNPLMHAFQVQQKGEKLPPCAISYFKQYFPDLNLDNIVVHTDGLPAFVQSFNTVPGGVGGFTFGNHIYFPRGAYDPHTVSGFADLGHEVKHVDQFRRLGTAGFVIQYMGEYLNNIRKQLPDGASPFPFTNPLALDTFAIKFRKWLDDLRTKYPNVDFNTILENAYKDISLEQDAYKFGKRQRDVLEKRGSPCAKTK